MLAAAFAPVGLPASARGRERPFRASATRTTVTAVPTYADFAPTRRFWPALAIAPDGSAVAYIADTGGQLNLVLQHLAGSPARP